MSFRLRPGFTLIEITMTIGILAILLTITLSISQNALGRSGLRTAENIIIQTLRRAQVLSQNNVVGPGGPLGAQWGIYICPGDPVATGCTGNSSIVLYDRDTFTNQDANDKTFEINPNITFAGDLYALMIATQQGLTFERFTGEPFADGFKGTIALSLNNETRTLIVNGKGVVERQ